MRVVMVGLSHQTAPVELRERVALAGDALSAALDTIGDRYPGVEHVIVSTCNRTELYIARPAHEPPDGDALRALLAEVTGVPIDELTPATIQRENEQALSHLFRVASGLESMVLGEPQILGQLKRSYEEADARGAVGSVLHKVFQDGIAVAKRARHDTGIGEGRVSVGSVAVDYVRQVFDHFDNKTVVCVGAGEMAKLTLRHLTKLAPQRLWVANRSVERARELVEQLASKTDADSPPIGARSLDDLDTLLIEADIVVTSTGATDPVITRSRFKPLLRRRRGRPLVILDIAVPRDVEPTVGSLHDVYLYNIDDLQQVVRQTHDQRSDQIAACESLVREGVRSCLAQIQHRDIGQLIKALRRHMHDMGDAERQRTMRKLENAFPNGDRATIEAALDELTHRMVNKFLHMPLKRLDQRDPDAPMAFYASALRRLFGLEHDDDAPSASPDASRDPAPKPDASATDSADAPPERVEPEHANQTTRGDG